MARSSCCCTAFPSPGTPGATRWSPSPPPATGWWPPPSAATASTDAPKAVDAYTQLHLVGDLIGLLDALGESTAVVVGHDWGAPVAWNAAALRPDRFRAVVGMSVPFYGIQRSTAPPTAGMAELARDRFVYILYFQEPGVAEAELEADVRATLRRMMYSISGDIPESRFWNRPVGSTFLDTTVEPDSLPAWLTDADLDVFTAEFERSGFRGGLNYYRNIDRNAELMAPFAGRTVEQPAMFIGGDRDIVLGATPEIGRADAWGRARPASHRVAGRLRSLAPTGAAGRYQPVVAGVSRRSGSLSDRSESRARSSAVLSCMTRRTVASSAPPSSSVNELGSASPSGWG